MPSHQNDLPLIHNMQQTITQTITSHSNDHIILCGDFNRDIALIGHTDNLTTHPSQQTDYQWRHFTRTLGLRYKHSIRKKGTRHVKMSQVMNSILEVQ